MAKKFETAGSAKKIKEVAKVSAEKAQVIVVKMINNSCLHDCPNNHEDITDTADLENSIKELGFTDPIEVTSFGQSDGEYMIVSGHRRRSAGVKCGMEMFPCIVKSFDNLNEVENYVLLANSQRDSAKDPLLFCKRYKMHEEYLKAAGFQGKIRDEVAKRLGISTPQADRYNTMNKVILPVWDMIRDELVGMSSVLPMASHSGDEQNEIYVIMQEALKKDVTLTRDVMKQIVEGYRRGKKMWQEIAGLPRDSGLPLNGMIKTEPGEPREESKERSRNDEIRREFDSIAAEADKADADYAEWEKQQENGTIETDTGEQEQEDKRQSLTDDEKRERRGKDIAKELEKLNTCLSDIYTFASQEDARETLKNMASTFAVVVDEMYTISREYNLDELFDATLADMRKKVGEYD